MFTIIGGDGKEYGPATVAQIRAWIDAGRANLDTKAKAVGTEEWRRLGDFAEFNPAAAVLPPVVPPVATVAADLADPAVRLGAWFVDKVIAFACSLPGFLVIGLSVLQDVLIHHGDVSPEVAGRVMLGALLLTVFGGALLVVQCWLLTTRGQTIGKRVFGVRIVNVDDDTNPGFVKAVLLRWFVPGLITVFLNFVLLGYIFFLVDSCFIFRRDHRCIHDLIAGTRVVKA